MNNLKSELAALTAQRINRLPADAVEIMLAGAKEEIASINDDAKFMEKKTFALMAVMLSLMGFSGQFMQTLYEQNIFCFGVIVVLALSALYFAARSAYAKHYYGAFFDIYYTLEHSQPKYIQNQISFSGLLLLWYAASIAHNAKVVSAKVAFFNKALVLLTVTVMTAVIMFIVIDISMTNPQNGTP